MAPRGKRQTRLQFTPIPSSSPSRKDYSPSVQENLTNGRGRFNGTERRQSQEREPALLPSPEPSSQVQPGPLETSRAACSPEPVRDEDEDEDEIKSPHPKRRKISSNRPSQTTLTARRSSRLLHQSPIHIRPSSSASSSSNQRLHSVDVPSPTPPRRTRSAQAEKAPVQSSPPRLIIPGCLDLGSPETSGDDDDILVTKPAVQRHRPRRSLIAKDDFIVSDHDNTAPSTDGDNAPVTPSNPRKSNVTNQTPRSRRLKSRREHREIKEDLENLQDSDSPQLPRSRTRGAPVNKERERRKQYIELLKRRRAGEKEPTPFHTDDQGECQGFDDFAGYALDASVAFGAGDPPYNDESTSQDDVVPLNPDLDVEDDDFVVSDGEDDALLGRIGRPHPDIPLEFTSYATAKPRDLFIYVIEWLVKNKIAPAFSRHDPLWSLAFTKINSEATAQASSRLISSAWNGSFADALNARPFLAATPLAPGDDLTRGCDACKKTNRPVKYEFVFSGSAYHHDSLEPVSPDCSSNSDADDGSECDVASLDSRGRTLPPADTHFFLGRYCAANAELAHKFAHWKYNLNEDVMRYLDSHGILSAEEIVRRERSKGGQRKREKEAEEIVDQMKASGVIEELWKAFKADLEDARIGMEGHDRKGARGSKRIGSVRVPLGQALTVEQDGAGSR